MTDEQLLIATMGAQTSAAIFGLNRLVATNGMSAARIKDGRQRLIIKRPAVVQGRGSACGRR
jgi:hypothetical protein